MAPEQLAGEEVTERSDIYSLGLVLYEVFTGKAAFDGRTLEEIVRVRNDSLPSRPTSLVKDLDPAVERIILRCLETAPSDRPDSALAVAAALPGGDPLAAALAAGETPSPQLVAAAGENAGLSLRAGLICVVLALLGLAAFYAIGISISGTQRMDLPYSSEILQQKARDIAQQLGYPAHTVDSAEGFDYDNDFTDYLEGKSTLHPDWNEALQGHPSLLQYWLRLSPKEMVADEPKDNLLIPGIVDRSDPAPILSGMVEVTLDPKGQLVHLEAIPPELQTAPNTPQVPPPDWKSMFTAAGLDLADFQPTTPLWNSLASADTRAAWTGTYPGTSLPLRIEVGALRGKPVYFKQIGPWTKPSRMTSDTSNGNKAAHVMLAIVGALLLIGACLIAWRNYLRQKTDLQSTLRLGAVIFSLEMVIWLFQAHFVPTVGSLGLFFLAVSSALFFAAITCTLYLALEPYVRRHWPHAIISWSRVMTGKLRDPLVGRDLLYGVILGLIWAIAFEITYTAAVRQNVSPNLSSTVFFLGARHVIGYWLWHLTNSLQATLTFFFVMFILRVLLRKPWLAALAFVALWVGIKLQGNPHWMLNLPGFLVVYGVAAFMILRFGLITLATGIFVVDLLLTIPITTNPASWYMGGSLFVLATVVAMTLWGGFTALGGQKVFREQFFE